MVKFVTINKEFVGQRIDNFLARELKGLAKARIYRMLRKGEIRVNKGRIKPSYHLQIDDIVRLPPEKSYSLEPKINDNKLTLRITKPLTQLANKIIKEAILYEDDAILIINKPAGLAVHGGSGLSYGLIELLRLYYPKYLQLDLVHRLDRDTSGCILVTKKHSMLRLMHELLRAGNIDKQYHALVQGKVLPAQQVQVPLRKYSLSSGERLVKVEANGQAAVTKFKLLESYSNAMLLRAIPVTGRTHQIRVHAQHMGCPIAGDQKYGDKDFNKYMKQYGLQRLFLHAHTLKFVQPKTKRSIVVTAQYDANLMATLQQLT